MIWWMASLTSGASDRVTSFMATLRPMSMPKEMRASAATSPTNVPAALHNFFNILCLYILEKIPATAECVVTLARLVTTSAAECRSMMVELGLVLAKHLPSLCSKPQDMAGITVVKGRLAARQGS